MKNGDIMFRMDAEQGRGHCQYEANRGTRLGKILPNVVDFFLLLLFFIRLILLEDFGVFRLACSFFLATALWKKRQGYGKALIMMLRSAKLALVATVMENDTTL